MSEFKSPFRIIGGAKGSHCFHPVQIDMAGKGCPGGCAYCYARGLLEFRGNWNFDTPAKADITKIRKLFENAFDHEKDTKNAKALRECNAIRIGGMTDPLLFNIEGTRELIELCNQYDKHHILFTKSSAVSGEFSDILDNKLGYVQMTVSSWHPEWERKVEPGASSALDRLDAIKQLSSMDIPVAARIAPIVPDSPYYTSEFIDCVCNLAPNTIIAETMRFNPQILKQFDQIDIDMRQYITDDCKRVGSTIFYSVEKRKEVYDEIFLKASEAGIDFSVCETDEFEEFQQYWSNPNDCCNAPWNATPMEVTL